MKTNTTRTMNFFTKCLSSMASDLDNFTVHPGKDFSRHRLLDFETTVMTIMTLGGKSTKSELAEAFTKKGQAPTGSAFFQQRLKLNSNAMPYLFHSFQREPSKSELFKGYRLLAVDGTGVKIPNNKDDPESRHTGIRGRAPFNEIYVHALFDVNQKIYTDISITKLHKRNEPLEFVNMLERFDYRKPTIFLGDANYGTFNVMAHITNINQYFVLRTKDVKSNGSAASFQLPNEDTFDVFFPDLKLSRKTSDQNSTDPNIHYITRGSNFDFLSTKSKENKNPYFALPLRILRFQISEGKYETIYTNLDQEKFPLEVIKELYAKRWGIETSFRRLKYTVGVLCTHSKKPEFIYQEIYAKVIMFNFVSMCTTSVSKQTGEKGYTYVANFAYATALCRMYVRKAIKLGYLEENIFKNPSSVRPNRSAERKEYRKSGPINLAYVVA